MRKIKRFLILFLIFLQVFNYFNNDNIKAYAQTSSQIVLECNTGRILYENNAYSKMYMASTTKILTAICVIENLPLDKIVTVKKEYVGIEGSSIYLEEGEQLTVKELLYGLMLRSGNDCAVALAIETSGNLSSFADLMNDTAKKIGAKTSNFTNPHGLHDENHYTTAYDLALISRYAMKNQYFREIVGTKTINIPWSTRDYDRHLINKNKMLTNLDGATGIKTGFTKKAGRCLVTSCERNGFEVISVVLNCPSMWQISESIIENSFNRYINYKVIEADNIVDFIDNKNQKIGVYVKNDIYVPILPEEKSDIKTVIEYTCNQKEHVKKDSEIGIIKVFVKNNLLFVEKIYNIIDI